MSWRLSMIDPSLDFSITEQCELLGVSRSSYYYNPIPESQQNLSLMHEIDKCYLTAPFYGSRMMTAHLHNLGYQVNRKRISRLMKLMGLEAIYPKPKREAWQKKYGKFPYLLKEVEINSCNYAWGTDITYIPMNEGFLYLVVVLDLYSRFILSWELSNSLETDFCLKAVQKALKHGKPRIQNSDQGVQFTSCEYVQLLQDKGIEISMSGKGRCWDNIFVERFWRSLKYEEVYLKEYQNTEEAYENIANYIELFNNERPHSSLNYRTPAEVYRVA